MMISAKWRPNTGVKLTFDLGSRGVDVVPRDFRCDIRQILGTLVPLAVEFRNMIDGIAARVKGYTKDWQAIIWSKVGMLYWRIYASLGLSEFWYFITGPDS